MEDNIYPEHIITEWLLNTKYKDINIYLLKIIDNDIICTFGYSIGLLKPLEYKNINSFFKIEIATLKIQKNMNL